MPGIMDARALFAVAALAFNATAIAADDFFIHLHAEKAMANVTVFPGRAGPVAITIQLETPDERPLAAVAVTLSRPDINVAPATAQAQRTQDGRWRATMTVPAAGRWTLGLGIQITDSDKISIEAPILIK
jgi:hypothetical protein